MLERESEREQEKEREREHKLKEREKIWQKVLPTNKIFKVKTLREVINFN